MQYQEKEATKMSHNDNSVKYHDLDVNRFFTRFKSVLD